MFKNIILVLIFISFHIINAKQIHILHTNDMHSFINAHQYGKGFAWISGYIHEYKQKNHETLAIDAGDFLQGTPASTATKGRAIVNILNTMNYDVTTFGNHEFDYGINNLKKLIKMLKFPIVCSNIISINKGTYLSKPYIIKKIGDLKIAILGYTTPELVNLTIPENYKGYRILGERILDSLVKKLYSKVDMTIVISHCGYNEDKEMAERIYGIDLIIGGHSHTLAEKLYCSPVNKTYVVQAGCYDSYIGDLTIDLKKKHHISSAKWKTVKSGNVHVIPYSPTIKAIKRINNKLGKKFRTIIAEVLDDLNRENYQSTIGNFVCNLIKNKFNCDVVIQNPGGLRIDIPKGPLRVGDIWSLSPFDNKLVKLKLTGKQLKDMLLYQLQQYFNKNSEAPMQLAGINYVYNISNKKFKQFSLDPTKIYSVIMNDFIQKQSKYYFNTTFNNVIDTNYKIRELLIDQIKKQKVIRNKMSNKLVIEQ